MTRATGRDTFAQSTHRPSSTSGKYLAMPLQEDHGDKSDDNHGDRQRKTTVFRADPGDCTSGTTNSRAVRSSNRKPVLSLLTVLLLVMVALSMVSLFETELRLESSSISALSISTSGGSGAGTTTNDTITIEPLGSAPVARPAKTLQAVMTSAVDPLTPRATSNDSDPTVMVVAKVDADDDAAGHDDECLGWHRTGACSPDGPREPQGDSNCNTTIPHGASGYCVFRHRHTNTTRRVLPLHCDSLSSKKESIAITCSMALELLAYGQRALQYDHDAASPPSEQEQCTVSSTSDVSLARGITMVVHGAVLGSAYASIRQLRALGSTLPVEIWFRRDEIDHNHHNILNDLVTRYGVVCVREIRNPLATKYYTKLHAVFYSVFDHVLLMDADNFAAKDPSYLFDTHEYQATGAMFWPDFWQPRNTIFNLHANSLAWQVFDVPFVDMFEQESGQVMIDRQRHHKALNVLMYYGFSLPRVHEQLRLVWGDKDLFRLAWLKTNSSFHFITRPPGAVGKQHPHTKQFCGMTMAQYDPHNDIVFLHRNMEKLRLDNHANKRVWTHVQQFNVAAPTAQYNMGWAKVFSDIGSCWGHASNFLPHYTVTAIDQFPRLKDLEPRLLQFVQEASAVPGHRL